MRGKIHPPFILAALFIIIAGCLEYPRVSDRPVIANLVYYPLEAPVNPGGTVTLTGSIDFFKKSGEITSVNVATYDAQGKQTALSSTPVSGTAGQTEGALAFGVDFGTSAKGNYTFEIHVIDGTGRQSNKLTGPFEVTDLF